jgi:hypothetical protein
MKCWLGERGEKGSGSYKVIMRMSVKVFGRRILESGRAN